MPRRKATPSPDQGAMFVHGAYEHESVLDPEKQFTRYTGQIGVGAQASSDSPEMGAAIDVIQRNIAVRETLYALGDVAQTAPAEKADYNPGFRKKMQTKYGERAAFTEEGMRNKNPKSQQEVDDKFKTIWGYEALKASGILDDAKVEALFKEDKADFVEHFSENPKTSIFSAKTRRANYQRMLREVESTYRQENVGVWPAVTPKKSGPKKRKQA